MAWGQISKSEHPHCLPGFQEERLDLVPSPGQAAFNELKNMNTENPKIRFVSAAAISETMIYVAAALYFDESDPVTSVTRMFAYNAQLEGKWFFHDTAGEVASVAIRAQTAASPRWACALTGGTVELYNSNASITETIFDESFYSPLVRIRCLSDGRLYVCGSKGQIFYRDGATWHSCSHGIGASVRPLSDSAAAQDLVSRLSLIANPVSENDFITTSKVLSADAPRLRDIVIASDETKYVVGMDGYIASQNASGEWARLDVSLDEHLISVVQGIEAGTVTAVGYNGSVLTGSRKAGFVNQSSIEDNQYFYSVRQYGAALLIGSSDGLWISEGGKLTRAKTKTRLDKKGTECVEVDVVNGVCWVVTGDGVFRLENNLWQEISHPDIPFGGYPDSE